MGIFSSIIGGIFKRKAQKEANYQNSPQGQVANWEAAGINPITGITSGANITQSAVSMGDIFADAGTAIEAALSGKNIQKTIEETQRQNEVEGLREAVAQLTVPDPIGPVERTGLNIPTVQTRGQETPHLTFGGPSQATGDKGQGIIEGGVNHGLSFTDTLPEGDLDARGRALWEYVRTDDDVYKIPLGPDIDEVISGAVIGGVDAVADAWEDPGQWASDLTRTTGRGLVGIAGGVNRTLDALLPYSENVYGLANLFEPSKDPLLEQILPRGSFDQQEIARYGRELTPRERAFPSERPDPIN